MTTQTQSSTAHRAPRTLLALALLGPLLSACGHGGPPRALEGRASDEWTRSYPLGETTEFQIVGGNGRIEVAGGDGQTVEVKAERVARAATEASAREIVPRIQIREDVTPDRIVLQTEGLKGIMIGVEVEVNYKVTVPRAARLRLRQVNGPVTVTGVDGKVVVSSVNGAITVRNQGAGGLEARTVNQGLTIDLAAFGTAPVDLRTTNGSINLTVPRDISASLLLNVQNGKMEVEDLPFESNAEENRRRTRGRLNAGGSPIEASTVNGSIRVHPRQ